MKTRVILVCAVVAWALPCLGVVNIGDTPQIQFRAVDGTQVSLAALKGKMVIVDMWATWCGPCMAEAPHMVQINQTYAAKGLQIIGISLDADQAQMVTVAKQKGFTWPQYFDGQVWKNKYAVQFGVEGIPFTMLIGPEGKVLWSGHPALLDEPLAKAFQEHPPQLVDPAILEQGETILAQINEKLADQDAKGAIQLLAKIPAAARADGKFAAKADEAAEKVQTAASAMLAEVQPMIDSQQYAQAANRLNELSHALAGTDAGDKARDMLKTLEKNPQAQQAIAEDEKKTAADAALATARKLQADKQDALAYPRFKAIVKDFPGTDAASSAATAVAAYEQNPEFMQSFTAADTGKKAKALLSVAKSYTASGQSDLATEKYQQVIAQFPGTPYADTAKQALEELGK
jgi:thiol-disulfide isomerase/thioredoxin